MLLRHKYKKKLIPITAIRYRVGNLPAFSFEPHWWEGAPRSLFAIWDTIILKCRCVIWESDSNCSNHSSNIIDEAPYVRYSSRL